jgi:hypothetical protein
MQDTIPTETHADAGDGRGVGSHQPLAQRPRQRVMSAELEARRTAAAAVLADYRAALASASLSRPPGRAWLFCMERALADLLAADARSASGRRMSVARCRRCPSHPQRGVTLCVQLGPTRTQAGPPSQPVRRLVGRPELGSPRDAA